MDKGLLRREYVERQQSIAQISKRLGTTEGRVNYWLKTYGIPRRTRSEAVYIRNHPDGDPFCVKEIKTPKEKWLQGLGLGLYWGEGNKKCIHSVRLGNTDPQLLRHFKQFLVELYGVDPSSLKYGLQIFTDIDAVDAINYWQKEMNASAEQFYKPTVTISGKIGTYRHKSKNGVLTLYYHNKKLRDILVGQLPR